MRTISPNNWKDIRKKQTDLKLHFNVQNHALFFSLQEVCISPLIGVTYIELDDHINYIAMILTALSLGLTLPELESTQVELQEK